MKIKGKRELRLKEALIMKSSGLTEKQSHFLFSRWAVDSKKRSFAPVWELVEEVKAYYERYQDEIDEILQPLLYTGKKKEEVDSVESKLESLLKEKEIKEQLIKYVIIYAVNAWSYPRIEREMVRLLKERASDEAIEKLNTWDYWDYHEDEDFIWSIIECTVITKNQEELGKVGVSVSQEYSTMSQIGFGCVFVIILVIISFIIMIYTY